MVHESVPVPEIACRIYALTTIGAASNRTGGGAKVRPRGNPDPNTYIRSGSWR